MQKISIIVPVYKVEKYLDRCVESIVNQTYKDLEIILVDDGSPDDCPKMCDEWAEKDERIKVVHKVNGGLTSARNAGLDVATGEYIQFVDSDDYLEKKASEILITNLQKNNADLSVGNFTYVGFNLKQPIMDSFITTKQSEVIQKLYTQGLFNFVWNKMYKKSLILNKESIVQKYGEDFLFNCEYLKNCNKIAYINERIYNYVANQNSIVHSFSVDCFPNHCKVVDYITNHLQTRYSDIYDFCNYLKSEFILSCFKGVVTTKHLKRKEKLKIINEYMNNTCFKENVIYAKGLKRKVQLFCLKNKLINLLKIIYNIKH